MKKLLLIVPFFIIFSQPVMAASAENVQQNASQLTMQEDEGILEWLIVLNKTEIAAAKEVLSRQGLKPIVKRYAQFLIAQHTQLLNETTKLAQHLKLTPMDNANADKLKEEGQGILSQLQPLDSEAIQKPYIDDMVKGHTEALAAINGYLKTEQNPAIKNLLKVTYKHVAIHLQKAKTIQKKLS